MTGPVSGSVFVLTCPAGPIFKTQELDLEETVIEGWGVNENIEMVDRVAHCANKLQGWGKRKKVKVKEKIDECAREMEALRDKRH
ncbi:hypothetical protein A2U01_0022119 [Trifolium medium]|uniref:Uncharacterized protein n=1 Tax=Trifolium medium TaxID=97028 RepID=A0A392NRI5_9FABA|nr:hypothetical protein [Trifolium medium]